jgi:hypothetical protein
MNTGILIIAHAPLASAFRSTTDPRALLMTNAPRFICASWRVPSRFVVDRVAGTCSDTTSACCSSSSSVSLLKPGCFE